MTSPFISRSLYIFLFSVLGVVYLLGAFVPLMDDDSAHHANISLHMHLSGDYTSLVDQGKNYLDKPHLLFWLSAFSYKIFGVTAFAYRFPSLLFTVLCVYGTYRLGKKLYNAEIGKLSALLIATAFAFILANNDVRMEAILTAGIVLATWQLVEFVHHKRLLNVTGAALGLAIGFCTKGHIGVFIPAIGILFYILYRKDWPLFLNPKWLLLFLLFIIFISPVVYCYYLQYNLHPEITVRGKDHINGVKFILLSQSVDRFSGEMGRRGNADYLFFFHSFLWAFAPWSILCFIAAYGAIKNFFKRKQELLTISCFVSVLLILSFSTFKLPHYLNTIFPAVAVLTAAFIVNKQQDRRWIKTIFIIQLVLCVLLLLLCAIVNGWAFPVHSVWVIAGAVILLAAFFYFIKSGVYNKLQKAVLASVAASALTFFLLNANFYPQLLTWQGGDRLYAATKGKINPQDIYFWGDYKTPSFNFLSSFLRQPFTDSVLTPGKKTWLLYRTGEEQDILQAGYTLSNKITLSNFEVTKLQAKFINPATREGQCYKITVAEMSKQ